MKNIRKSSDPMAQHFDPFLVSEFVDTSKFSQEKRLFDVAQTIPEYVDGELPSTIQSIISAAIHMTQGYLTQVVTAISLADPGMASMLVASTSGHNVIAGGNKVQEPGRTWIPPYPIEGNITMNDSRYIPSYACSSLVPAVCLYVNRNDDESPAIVELSVTDQKDMRSLAALMSACGKDWLRFEKAFGCEASSDIPLPGRTAAQQGITAAQYATSFIENIVDNAKDKDECLERLLITFQVGQDRPLHHVIHAACSLLFAHWSYKLGVARQSDDFKLMAVTKVLEAAIYGERVLVDAQVTREEQAAAKKAGSDREYITH